MLRLLVISVLSLFLAAGCVDGGLSISDTTEIHLTDSIYAIDLEGYNGSITWVGMDAGETSYIEVDKEVRGSSTTAMRDYLSNMEIQDLSSPGWARYRVSQPRRPSGVRSSNVRFTIYAPVDQITELHLRTSNGSVTVERFAGELNVRTSNGSVTVRDGAGAMQITTSNGTVRLHEVAFQDASQIITSNGRITGDVSFLTPARYSLETSNGAIELDFRRAFRGTLDVAASNGNLDIRLPGFASFQGRGPFRQGQGEPEVRIRTSNGNIRVREGVTPRP